jgi:predicted TIM-barrel fold metal-dependent hydrolase
MILSHVFCGTGLELPTLPLLRQCPNVHLDVLGIIKYWRTVAMELGPERVFFASGAPFKDPSTFVSNVQYARRLTPEDKKRICGDNLRRLMEGVR